MSRIGRGASRGRHGKTFVEFAARAFRRPLTDDEAERLFEIMRVGLGTRIAERRRFFKPVVGGHFDQPQFFLSRRTDPDRTDEDGIRELDGFELASRLSYFLWSSMPDERLFELANPAS